MPVETNRHFSASEAMYRNGEVMFMNLTQSCHSNKPVSDLVLKVGLILFFGVFLANSFGCASRHRLTPVPEDLLNQAEIPGMPGVRAWGDEYSPVFQSRLVEAVRRSTTEGELGQGISFLALSGGADYGAFGAGVLCGWTRAGNRPMFKSVTGISTGALIAPFAFLGPEYDEKLKQGFTTISADDIYKTKAIFTTIGSDSLTDSSPLARLIERFFDEKTIDAIAHEHRKGRILLVGTTNLEAQRPVAWDLGAIAASGHPKRVELFHKVVLASASMPTIFPPVYVEVVADGKPFDEMHVDGGTTVELFFYGALFDLRAMRQELAETLPEMQRNLFIIRNSKIGPEWKALEPKLFLIATRSIATLIRSQGVGDLFRIYTIAKRDGIGFNLAFIPDDFRPESTEAFNTQDMNRLFELGFRSAAAGYQWTKAPPGFSE